MELISKFSGLFFIFLFFRGLPFRRVLGSIRTCGSCGSKLLTLLLRNNLAIMNPVSSLWLQIELLLQYL